MNILLIDCEFPKTLHYSTNKIYSGMPHWKRTKIKQDYLWWMKSLNIKSKKIKEYPIKIKYEFFFKSKPYDSSNVSFMAKLIEDCLITEGIIENDSPKYVSSVEYKSIKSNSDHIKIKLYN